MKLFLLFGLSAAIPWLCLSSETSALIDYRLKNVTASGARAVPEDCASGEIFICKNCNQAAYCVGGQEVLGTPCAAGQTCSATGTCAPDTNGQCAVYEGVTFPCSAPGYFPDPGDCTKYHICIEADKNNPGGWVSTPKECLRSDIYYYNPRTTYCDKRKPSNGLCPGYPIPLCPTSSQPVPAPLKENPSIYYVCLPRSPASLYPYQVLCENGGIFSVSTGCKLP